MTFGLINIQLLIAQTFVSQGIAFKYQNIKKFSFFAGLDKLKMLFFLLINVKMPTIVGILTFTSRKIFTLS